MRQGTIIEDSFIKFEDVPIMTPNKEKLIDKLNIDIKKGMNIIMVGPNGCGKSSIFRILGNLWPMFGGKLTRPPLEKIFYIPQRPYLPPGTLRDQVIYPHGRLQMLRKRVNDEIIKNYLKEVDIEYLVEREGGLDAVNDWNDVLSGGEKQRMAMARMYYHKPEFAVLDDCTSAVSIDIESNLYNHCKRIGTTIITVSHRTSLFKFHDFLLRFDGVGGWSFEKLVSEEKV